MWTPSKLPGLAALFHKGIGVWWVFVVVGVIVIVVSAYLHFSRRAAVDAGVPFVAGVVGVLGAFCIYMSY